MLEKVSRMLTEHLPSKCKALSSNPSAAKRKKRRKGVWERMKMKAPTIFLCPHRHD
jgi:hypothetical protein